MLLKQDWIAWPTVEQKCAIRERSRDTLSFCLGIVDGTMTPLKYKPSLSGRFYSTYKKNYAVKWQVTCDFNKVRQLQAIQYGCIHDSTMYHIGGLYNRMDEYFDNEEYIIGDSAYPLSTTCLTPYNSNTRIVSTEHRRLFNKCLSKYRVRVEHCIGEIKKRFQSFEKLPIKI